MFSHAYQTSIYCNLTTDYNGFCFVFVSFLMLANTIQMAQSCKMAWKNAVLIYGQLKCQYVIQNSLIQFKYTNSTEFTIIHMKKKNL